MKTSDLLDPTYLTEDATQNPEVDKINVISPDGEMGSVNLDWFLTKGAQSGFTLPQDKSWQQDLEGTDKVKVIKRSDGQPGTVNINWFLSNPEAKKEFVLQSKYNPQFEEKVQQDLSDLQKDKGLFSNVEDLDVSKRHSYDELYDNQGNFKLLDLNNNPIRVSSKYVSGLLSAGFKFEDENAQSLFEAYERKRQDGLGKTAMDTLSGVAQSLPLVKQGLEAAYLKPDANILHQMDLIDREIQDVDSDAFKVGQVLGTVAQIASPTGIFGEVKAAQAAKAGLVAKLAPEGAGVLRTLGVKSLGSAVEGAIIASPQAISQAIIKENPMAAAESIGVGAGIGLALFGGGQLIRGAGSLLKKGSEVIKDTLIPTSLKGAGVSPQTIEELERLPAGAFPEGGKKYFSDLLKMEKLSRKSSNDDLINTAKKIAEGDDDVVQLLEKLDESAYQANKTYPLSSGELVSKIKSANQHLLQSSFQGEKAAQLIEEQAQKLVKMSENGTLSLSDAHQFVKSIGRKIDWADVKKMDRAQLETQIYRNIWSTSLDEIKKIGTEVSTASKNAELISLMARERFLMNSSQDIIGQSLVGVKPEFHTLVKTFTDLITNRTTGALAGAAGGGIPGAVIGQAIGSAANTIVGGVEDALARSWSKNPASKLGKWFMTNKATQGIGNFLAIDAVASMDSTIKQIAPVIQQLSGPTKTASIKLPLVFTGAENPIKEILGDQVNGLSKPQQIRKLSSSLSEAVSNPTAFNERFQLYIAPLFKDHPELTNQLYLDYQKKIQVLNDIVNAYNIKQPQAFQGKEKPYQPTPSQEQEMQGLLRVALNPYALLQAVQNGRVSTKQVEIVNQLNPAILAKMREAILVEAYSGKVKLPYQQRVALSVLMGAPMDPSLKNGAAMQAIYGQPMQQANGQPPKKQGNNKPLKPSKIATYTASQRISGL